MSSYLGGAGLTALVGGASFYLWKSGVIQRYMARESEPVADQFIKTAVNKHFTDAEKQAIIKKLSQGRLNAYEENNNKCALKAMAVPKSSFYLREKMNVRIDQIGGKSHVELADGQRVPIGKALDILERRKNKEAIDLSSLDEESRAIAQHYDERARQYILENTGKSFEDAKSYQDLKSSQISPEGIEQQLNDLKLERDYRMGKALRTIKKYADRKGDYRRALEKGIRTPDGQKVLDQFEDQAAVMDQILRASEKAPVHNIPPEEKLLPGFLNSSTHNLYTDMEVTRYNPSLEHDPVLHANIEAFKAKIAADPLLSSPLLKGNPLRNKIVCHQLMDHVNESFPVDIKDTQEIFHALGGYNTRNALGDYIDAGVGVCRHKALLTKALADHVGLDVSMNSGMYCGKYEVGPHAWNTIKIGDELHLLDAHNQDFRPWNDEIAATYRQGKSRQDI